MLFSKERRISVAKMYYNISGDEKMNIEKNYNYVSQRPDQKRVRHWGGELTGGVVRRHVSSIQCLAQF